MYQNAPPHYNQGYASPGPPPQAQYGGGGYNNGYNDNNNNNTNNMNQHPPPAYPGGGGGGGYGAPSPVNAAYQRANAAMAGPGMPPGRAAPSPSPTPMSVSNSSAAGGGASTTGLIRLTLRKPMGIVFEPMTDPHNPSQQRGVRICDLPRTGAAAMSQKLEVGDELLSINDKTMSRLTFDEIMDFIIEADKERVDLLFRRPSKDKLKDGSGGNEGGGGRGSGNNAAAAAGGNGPGGAPLSPMGLGGIGSNSNSVKWIDEKSDVAGGKLTEDVQPDREDPRRNNNNDRNNRDRGGSGKNQARQDDPSIDDTYNDGYTVESQSQYTMETYEEDRGGGGRGGGRVGRGGDSRYSEADYKDDKKSSRRNNKNDRERDGKRKDPVESTGFLDLLIDTLCTSVMGRDARDMCGDRTESDKKEGNDMKNKGGYRDEEDEFTVDDGTYATYEEQNNHRGNNMNQRHHDRRDEESLVTEDEGTLDDGTRTLESKEVIGNNQHLMKENLHNEPKKGKDKSKPKEQETLPYMENDEGGYNDAFVDDPNQFQRTDPPQHHHGGPAPFDQQVSAPDPPTKAGPAQLQQHHQHQQQPPPHEQQYQPQIEFDHQMNEQESAIASGIALPVRELEYDNDYAADVSVMESLGGPSLLVERARHENAVHTGADRASFENLDRQDPELAELIAQHSDGFLPDPGMTKEETAFRDPYKFYEHAVCNLLRDNEPEKVRLLSKLMAKYRGRERHLINKLSARYEKDKGANDGGNNDGNGGAGDQAAPNIESSRSKSSAGPSDNASSGNNNNLANKPSMSGMEQIQEAGDEEETAGSSSLNDPSRANIAAIETAKKKTLESSGGGSPINKAPKDSPPKQAKSASNEYDGWPPAMADPWGTGSPGVAKEPIHAPPPPDHHHHDEDAGSRPTHIVEHDDDGSYSDDGSSYSGEDESQGVDGTSPAIIAQVSELLNYVYGKTSVAGQIDRVSTIMRAYEGREAVLLELLETKALIKANADSNWDTSDLPVSLRNSPGLNNNTNGGGNQQGQPPGAVGDGGGNSNNDANTSEKKMTPQTPVSVLTTPTLVEYPASGSGNANHKPLSPESVDSPKEALSPSAGTLNTFNTMATGTSNATKKKKKGMFGGFFGGKKKDKKGNFPSGNTAAGDTINTKPSPGKGARRKMSKKGQRLNEEDRSI